MSKRFALQHSYRQRPARGLLVLVVPLIVVAGSCGHSDRVTVHLVEGSAFCQSKPVTGALVVFHPLDPSEKLQKLRPAGKVDAEGRFVLSTYGPKDGAPEGEYRVTIVWASAAVEGKPGPDRFGGRYASPQKSPLTATVTAGKNTIEPFDLQQ
ncbi:MAG: hypothetical protein JW818_18490 [Pirellulales bacterium]|nr:hypothetical protein [Pirellulales bacterium]